MKMLRGVVLLLVALSLSAGLQAEIRLPHVLSSHAVLQRNRPIHIWGWATPGAHVTVRLLQQNAHAVANELGEWGLWLAPEPAGGPYTLTVSGDGTPVTLTDILIGDVWVASGQSNMQIPLEGFPGSAVIQNGAEAIAAARDPDIRLLLVPLKSSDIPLDDQTGSWTRCTPQTASKFSAVAYFFGREIGEREHVPVGLIDSSWGGTPISSWISLDTLGTEPQLLPAFAARARFADQQTEMPAIEAEEKREDQAAQAAGQPLPSHPWRPDDVSWLPAALYNGMIAPLVPLTVRGFLWYQGETNATPHRAPYYSTAFPALIQDWRSHFAQGNLPFLFVQISSYDTAGDDWGLIRDAQRRTLATGNTGMAVTLDIGEAGNIHPPDKQDVAHRLALAARHLAYGEDVAWQSPLFREATPELEPDGTTAIRVWFSHANGLTTHGTAQGSFEIAGADRRFVPAQARIEGQTVLVWSPSVPQPVYVRYGWAGFVKSYFYNAAGLPASTFTSERDPAE